MASTHQIILTICENAKAAAHQLAQIDNQSKNRSLAAIAAAIEKNRSSIISANQKDIDIAKNKNRNAAFIDRLLLDDKRIQNMADSLHDIAKLPDPVNKILAQWKRPNGLNISKVSVPLGVILMIYESRPNVTVDASALCIKSGNAVILRSSHESFFSAEAIYQCIQQGIAEAELPAHCVQLLPIKERAAVDDLVQMTDYIDVVIPRGGESLIQHLMEVSKIPLFKHLSGLCHTYIHKSADLNMAIQVTLNAKMRRTGICGATETVLIDESVANQCLPKLIDKLLQASCEVRGDKTVQAINPKVKPATSSDWDHEYLDAIVSIKTVKHLDEAIEHINRFGSHHTDAIITTDQNAAEQFLQRVDSAITMHNSSTQFADGGEFGMGAEIGISTGKIHARGPVGVEQLTSFKYQVRGQGQTRPD